ncbi:hypothetical protein PTKIN_Ptkin02bG0188100 [Pterospermum kingtungense]
MDDRFSALSEQLSYRILSLLNIDDLGRLMLVSRRCKSLCVSVPSLTIDNRNFIHNLISRQFFILLVDNFLVQRATSGTKTLQFTLVWSFIGSRCDQKKKRKKGDKAPDPEESLVIKWVSKAISDGAERVSINIVRQEGMPDFFPVFYSKSVKEITFCSYYNFDSGFPQNLSLGFPMLESLTLQSSRSLSIFIIGISDLHSLKSLYLYDFSGPRTISIPNPIMASFWISCSALQDFVWYGYPVKFRPYEQNWSHLKFAALYLTLPPGSEVGSFSKSGVEHLLPILESSAKFLRLHFETIEILFKLGHLTTQVDAVRNLAIDYCILTDEQVPIIVSFLKKISCLVTFYLTSSPTIDHGSCEDVKLNVAVPDEVYGFNVEYWGTRELMFIDQLKKATVEVHGEKGNGVELVKYMLKHAGDLEYLTVVCAPSLASGISERLSVFIKDAASTKFNFCLKPLTK